jgi:ABC-2 type transport system permease protein
MLIIARRELLERIRTRWFVAITLLGPVGMLAIVLVPALIASRTEGARVEIVDKTGALAEPIAAAVTLLQWQPKVIAPDTPDAVEMAKIRDEKINGFLTIPANALDGGQVVYRGDNASNATVQAVLRQLLTSAVQAQRGARAGLSTGQLAEVFSPVNFEAQHTSGKEAGASGLGSFLIGYFLAFTLYMVITLYGVGVMRSVVQEKTSRAMELMVATVKPRALMTGKILGVGTAGLIQLVVWLGMGALSLAYRDEILHWLGAKGGGAALPALSPGVIGLVVAFFILGFFFYASLYAAVGAMISSEGDTQQAQMPVTILLVFGLVCIQMVSNDPRSTAAMVMTLVPFWSPMLMPMRYLLGGASPVELAVSLGILVISTVLIARAAAKIYRVGVLMYGKRPGLGEVIRWLRY